MKSECRTRACSLHSSLCFALLGALVFGAQVSNAQEKAAASKNSTATNAQPHASPTPPPSSSSQSSTTSGGQQPTNSGGVDDEDYVNTDLVKLTITVTDSYGRFVTGLERNSFTVTDEKTPQDILFFSDEDAPASIGVLFDVSGSMSGDKISRAREALSRFIATSHEQDEYFLIGFNSRAQLLLDRTRDADALLNKLTFVETKGNTALYDATYLGVEKVLRGAHEKRVLLIISDGQDNNSRYTFSEVRRLLKESGVLIYTIGITRGTDTLDAVGRSYLEELSGVSGGKAFFPDTTAELNEIFEKISVELRHQYAIAYRPTNFVPNGKWRRVKVKVQPPRGLPRVTARTKDGYFAVANAR